MKRKLLLASIFVLPNVTLFMVLLLCARSPFGDALMGAAITPYVYGFILVDLLLSIDLSSNHMMIGALTVIVAFVISCSFSHKTTGLLLAIALLVFHYLLTAVTICVLALGGLGSG
jgi:hypothetical protein